MEILAKPNVQAVLERLSKAMGDDDEPGVIVVASVFERMENSTAVRPYTMASTPDPIEIAALLDAASLAIKVNFPRDTTRERVAVAMRCPFCGELVRPTEDLVAPGAGDVRAHRACVSRYIDGAIAEAMNAPASRN